MTYASGDIRTLVQASDVCGEWQPRSKSLRRRASLEKSKERGIASPRARCDAQMSATPIDPYSLLVEGIADLRRTETV